MGLIIIYEESFMKIFYQSFGCKVSQYETENIEAQMKARGFETVSRPESADIAVINTCTVTSGADSKCRQAMHRVKKQNPRCILCAMGCMTQVAGGEAAPQECDIVIGSRNKTLLPELIGQYLATGQRIIAVTPITDEHGFEAMQNTSVESRTRAYIKIQDGCDMYCTYCIIPYARGHICSKPLNEIKEEAAALVLSGHKELILTGINLCCYGRDFKNGTRLIDAIEAVCAVSGDFRVRLSSVEPEMISDGDIQRMARLEKLCPHFHLSLQSGCDKTLKAMKRHYTAAEYLELCQRLRESFPDCAVTTDIMVGFPGESEQDHKQSLEFAALAGFADAHIFPYSRRKGTVADTMPCQVEGSIKHRRAREMAQTTAKTREEYMKRMQGRTLKVLFEKETDPRFHQGHSGNYLLVRTPRVDESVSLRREFKNVRITGYDAHGLTGDIEE